MNRLLALALVALVALPAATAAVPRTESRTYVASAYWSAANILCHPDVNVGGACFVLDGSERVVRVEVADRLGNVPAEMVFVNSAGLAIAYGDMCGARTMVAPAGAAELWVWTGHAPQFVDPECPPRVGVPGRITVHFS